METVHMLAILCVHTKNIKYSLNTMFENSNFKS